MAQPIVADATDIRLKHPHTGSSRSPPTPASRVQDLPSSNSGIDIARTPSLQSPRSIEKSPRSPTINSKRLSASPSTSAQSSQNASRPSTSSSSREAKRWSQKSPMQLTSPLNSNFSIPAIARQHVHAASFSSQDPGSAGGSTGAKGRSGAEAGLHGVQTAPRHTKDAAPIRRSAVAGSDDLSFRGSSQSSGSASASEEDSLETRSDVTSVPSEPEACQILRNDGAAFLPAEERTVKNSLQADLAPSSTHTRAQDGSRDPTSIPKPSGHPQQEPLRFATLPNTLVQETLLEHHRSQQRETPPRATAATVPSVAQRDALAARVYEACQNAGHDDWVHLLDLAPLASQHHLSGYNCLKFGREGSPFVYLPLTLQQPSQTGELMAKQKVSEANALEWLAQKRGQRFRSMDSPKKQRLMSPSGSDGGHIDEDISKAGDNDTKMREASPIPPTQPDPIDQTFNAQHEGQTTTQSDPKVPVTSGPLKAEASILQEWEEPISSQSSSQESQNGEAVSAPETSAQDSGHAIKTSDTHPISISPIIPPELLVDISRLVRAGMPATVHPEDASTRYGYGHAGGTDAESLATEHEQMQMEGKRLIRCRTTLSDLSEVALKAERELREASQGRRRPRLLQLEQSALRPHRLITTYRGDDEEDDFTAEAQRTYAALNGNAAPFARAAHVGSKDHGFVMGNLLLSSCPGKKVRLTGPVRGRGAICRSLDLDLKRIKELGVGAVVCCLDNEEMAFLGAPWAEYEYNADKLGLEVIRLPMSEGFCPTDVAATDEAIECVVNDYTLRGVHVLVHCRGGVGRAGLIACMWMLKLGLVRSDADENLFRSIVGASGRIDNGIVQRSRARTDNDVRQTVARLIETIRRRRSPKAIETAEQVVFLTKYVKYLYDQESTSWQYAASHTQQTAPA